MVKEKVVQHIFISPFQLNNHLCNDNDQSLVSTSKKVLLGSDFVKGMQDYHTNEYIRITYFLKIMREIHVILSS